MDDAVHRSTKDATRAIRSMLPLRPFRHLAIAYAARTKHADSGWEHCTRATAKVRGVTDVESRR
jgi:hypothetical protein